MPKELVYSKDALREPTANGYPVEHVAVGWSKGDSVQIGMVNGPSIELEINGVRADPGMWMDLDREQINRLIRSLRTARDSAYGRDE